MNLSRTYSLFTVVMAFLFVMPAIAQQSDEGSSSFSNDPNPKVEIYPNPATEFISIKMGKTDHNFLKVNVHNIIGNPITIELERSDEQVILNIKDLPSGYYLLTVKTDDPLFRGTYKFLKR